MEQQSRDEELVFWRNLPGPVLLRALPLHLAVLAGKAWRRWREGQLLPFLLGRLSVLGRTPALMRHRRWLRQIGPGTDVRLWAIDTGWPTSRRLRLSTRINSALTARPKSQD
jgi:hypothetical protein